MKQTLNFAIVLSFLLAACSSTTATPLVTTKTPIPLKPTLIESLTLTPSKTPIETLIPPIETLSATRESVSQFSRAIQKAGINITVEQILQQGLKIQSISGLNGKQYEIATTHLDPDPNQKGEALEGDYPLMFKMEKGEWEKAAFRSLADAGNISLAAPIKNQYLDKPGYAEIIKQNVNKVLITEDLSTLNVFRNFDRDTWQKVLDNWDEIKKQLDDGVVPSGYDYDWNSSKTVIDFAKKNNMAIKAQCLLFASDLPDAIFKSNFTPEQLSKILEFTVKVKILQYKGQIQEWDVSDEALMNIVYMNADGNELYGFWFRNLGGEQAIIDVASWAKQADPSIKLVLTEDHVMEQKFGNLQPHLNKDLFNFLKRVKQENVPIDGVDIENNLWIYNPPEKAYMKQTLKQIADLGFYIATSEATITTSEKHPTWYEQPAPPIKVTDPLKAQAALYQATLEAYLESGANGFGFGDLSDQYSWLVQYHGDASAMVLDSSNNPKLAYYAISRTILSYVTR